MDSGGEAGGVFRLAFPDGEDAPAAAAEAAEGLAVAGGVAGEFGLPGGALVAPRERGRLTEQWKGRRG